MAFQCRGCYRNKTQFDGTISRSTGPCENCHYTDVCIDAPFNTDPNWRANLKRDLVRIGHMKETDDILDFIKR